MPDIMVLFACLSQCLEPTLLRQLGRVIEAMLSMSGRVTMRGLSRWAGKAAVTGRSNVFSMPACTGVISTGSSFAIMCWTPMTSS